MIHHALQRSLSLHLSLQTADIFCIIIDILLVELMKLPAPKKFSELHAIGFINDRHNNAALALSGGSLERAIARLLANDKTPLKDWNAKQRFSNSHRNSVSSAQSSQVQFHDPQPQPQYAR
jgi:hypothetical protein